MTMINQGSLGHTMCLNKDSSKLLRRQSSPWVQQCFAAQHQMLLSK